MGKDERIFPFPFPLSPFPFSVKVFGLCVFVSQPFLYPYSQDYNYLSNGLTV